VFGDAFEEDSRLVASSHLAPEQELQGGHLGRQQKETAAKIAALQFLGFSGKPVKPGRSTAILAVGPVGILPAESGSRAAPQSVALPGNFRRTNW
jgi:hypothetical protein